MPILVKDYTWAQSAKMVNIRIPARPGSYHENVDIFTTDIYVKVNFSPFLFEVFPLHDIDSERSKAIVKDDLIVLDLAKREEIEWETLEKELTKQEKLKLKQDVLDKCVEEAQQKAEDKRIKRQELDRFTVQRAMDIDSKQHNLMNSRRDSERNKAMESLEEWRVNTTEKESKGKVYVMPKSDYIITEITSGDEEETNKDPDTKKVHERRKGDTEALKPETNDDSKTLNSDNADSDTSTDDDNSKKAQKKEKPKIPPPRRLVVKTPIRSDYVNKKKDEMKKRVLPKLRETAELVITHTPRTFPTPSRESANDEEQAWLKNITAARRATGFMSEDLRPEEQDPQWCKAKGDEFFRNGNFLGAMSAYTHAITLSDKLPSLYANRSATHFALGNFNKCINDCSTALDLMKPACEGNRKSRAKCISRRGAALARMGYLSKGIDEMKAAAKMLPEDETIKKDIYDMERAWEQNPDSD